MSLDVVVLLIAAVSSLPGGLFVARLLSTPRARWVAPLGGILGAAAVALAIYAYVQTSSIRIDALSYGLGAFFACSVGVMAGALIVDFLVGAGRRSHSTYEM